jgi:YD repeat-containing protein
VESYVSNAATFKSYDPMGRIADEWQCTPQNCGTSYFSLAYTYDLLGDILSSSNGAGVTLSYLYNSAAQPTTLTSSLVDSNHPATLFSNVTYNAPGLLVAGQFGNSVSETRIYDDRLRLTSIADGSVYTLRLSYTPNSNANSAVDSINGTWEYGTAQEF